LPALRTPTTTPAPRDPFSGEGEVKALLWAFAGRVKRTLVKKTTTAPRDPFPEKGSRGAGVEGSSRELMS